MVQMGKLTFQGGAVVPGAGEGKRAIVTQDDVGRRAPPMARFSFAQVRLRVPARLPDTVPRQSLALRIAPMELQIALMAATRARGGASAAAIAALPGFAALVAAPGLARTRFLAALADEELAAVPLCALMQALRHVAGPAGLDAQCRDFALALPGRALDRLVVPTPDGLASEGMETLLECIVQVLGHRSIAPDDLLAVVAVLLTLHDRLEPRCAGMLLKAVLEAAGGADLPVPLQSRVMARLLGAPDVDAQMLGYLAWATLEVMSRQSIEAGDGADDLSTSWMMKTLWPVLLRLAQGASAAALARLGRGVAAALAAEGQWATVARSLLGAVAGVDDGFTPLELVALACGASLGHFDGPPTQRGEWLATLRALVCSAIEVSGGTGGRHVRWVDLGVQLAWDPLSALREPGVPPDGQLAMVALAYGIPGQLNVHRVPQQFEAILALDRADPRRSALLRLLVHHGGRHFSEATKARVLAEDASLAGAFAAKAVGDVAGGESKHG